MKSIKNWVIVILCIIGLLSIYDSFNRQKKVDRLKASNEVLKKYDAELLKDIADRKLKWDKKYKDKDIEISKALRLAENARSKIGNIKLLSRQDIARLRSRGKSLVDDYKILNVEHNRALDKLDLFEVEVFNLRLTIEAQRETIDNLWTERGELYKNIHKFKLSLDLKDRIIDKLLKLRGDKSWISIGPGFAIIAGTAKFSALTVNIDVINFIKQMIKVIL